MPLKSKTKQKSHFSLSQKLFGYFQLVRGNNILILILSILAAFVISEVEYSPVYRTVVLISASLIFAGGNALNDYFDLATDIINRASRPLPSGKISPSSAKNFGIALLVLGILLTYFLARFHLFCATIAGLILFLYDVELKKRFLIGNIAIAFLSGLVFIYAGGPKINLPLFFTSAFAFLLHLAREIIKDMEDIAGDIVLGASTLPIKLGTKKSSNIVACILLSFLVLLFLPYALRAFGPAYFYISLFGILPIVSFVLIEIKFGKQGAKDYRLLSFLLKTAMLIGIIALIAGKGFK